MNQFSSIMENLKKNKVRLSQKYKISEMVVFGSAVREDFTPKSDIDIMVDFREPIGIEFIELADELEKILEHKVDLVSKKGIKAGYWTFIKDELNYV